MELGEGESRRGKGRRRAELPRGRRRAELGEVMGRGVPEREGRGERGKGGGGSDLEAMGEGNGRTGKGRRRIDLEAMGIGKG